MLHDKSFSHRSAWIILLFMLVLFSACAATFYATVNTLVSAAETSDPGSGDEIAQSDQLAALVKQKAADLNTFILPSLAVGFMAIGFFLWLVLRSVADGAGPVPQKGAFSRSDGSEDAKADRPGAAQREANLHQRLFIHLLSVLQREGRLVDFFSEDLDAYEDAQIGTAVRSIHENCKAGLEKYLKLEPVVSNPEGQTITLKPDFDPAAIKVVGNVTGDPPFTGVVRHRGWRAVNIDIPTLTNVRDAGLIVPAEIEVL